MGIESADDLSDFFLTDDFGIAATYTAAGESAATINVLFDDPFSSVPLDSGERDVESNTPTALAVSSDVSTQPSVGHESKTSRVKGRIDQRQSLIKCLKMSNHIMNLL